MIEKPTKCAKHREIVLKNCLFAGKNDFTRNVSFVLMNLTKLNATSRSNSRVNEAQMLMRCLPVLLI